MIMEELQEQFYMSRDDNIEFFGFFNLLYH